MNAIILPDQLPPVRELILSGVANGEQMYRLQKFVRWMEDGAYRWHEVDTIAYRDYLLLALSPRSVSAHLSTVRMRYRKLIRDNALRKLMYSTVPAGYDLANAKAFVDELYLQLENAIHPDTAPVKVATVQDVEDSKHVRLKPHEAQMLIHAPGTKDLIGLRDTALLSLMLCTGIREAEACSIDVDDLRQRLNGNLALRVRDGKGSKQRLVPYGAWDWCLTLVDLWMENAGIKSGAVFRGMHNTGEFVLTDRLSRRSVVGIVNKYKIMVDGKLRNIAPHDLRRSYAWIWYHTQDNPDILALMQNLGHAKLETTQGYIGQVGTEKRLPRGGFTFDFSKLNGTS